MEKKTYLNWLKDRSGSQEINEFAFLAPLAGMALRAGASMLAQKATGAVVNAASNMMSGGQQQQQQQTVQEDPPVKKTPEGSVPISAPKKDEEQEKEPPQKEEEDDSYPRDQPKPSGLDAISLATKSNLSDIVGKPTQSAKTTQAYSPFYSYQGGYGMFQPIALKENSLNKMVNKHVSKFLKSKHGKQLKGEVNQIVSEKNLNN